MWLVELKNGEMRHLDEHSPARGHLHFKGESLLALLLCFNELERGIRLLIEYVCVDCRMEIGFGG